VGILVQGDVTRILCIRLSSAWHPVYVPKKDATTLVLFDAETLVISNALSNLRMLFCFLAGTACLHLDAGKPKIQQLSVAWKWSRRMCQAASIKCASNAMKMSLRLITSVLLPAGIIASVDIPVLVAAFAATHAKTEKSRNKTTAYATSAAAESPRPVNITALRAVTVMYPVSRARNDAKYGAVTRGVARLVASLVILVRRQPVSRDVFTPGVRPHVLLLVTGCLAL